MAPSPFPPPCPKPQPATDPFALTERRIGQGGNEQTNQEKIHALLLTGCTDSRAARDVGAFAD
jgi:hypothetical protein